MDEGLVQIILALIGLLSTIITALVVPLIKKKYDAAKRQEIYEYVDIAVNAADQILKAIDPSGVKRKQYVLDFLDRRGIKVKMEDLDAMIEAAVQRLNILQKQVFIEE